MMNTIFFLRVFSLTFFCGILFGGPVQVKDGIFYEGQKPVFLLGPVHDWTENLVRDRTGVWSTNRAYRELPDREMFQSFGMNAWQPQGLMSYFAMREHFPESLRPVKWFNMNDYFREIEGVSRQKLNRLSGIQLTVDFSEIGLWQGLGPWAKKNGRTDYFQKTGEWHDFLPFDPSYPQAMTWYLTMFREGAKFVLSGGGDPVLYELGNEVFYNSFSEPNIAAFQTWLEKRHGDFSSANRAWGANYPNFSSMMDQLKVRLDKVSGPWYDWMLFLGEVTAGHFKAFRDEILSVDRRPGARAFTVQPHHQTFSFNGANAINSVALSFLEAECTEYTGLTFTPMGDGPTFDGKDMMAAGFTVGNRESILGAALGKAYSRGRLLVDNETRTTRMENGIRVPSWEGDISTTLWNQVMFDYSQTILYTWGNRDWEWATYEEARKSALSEGYKEGYLLNPYNYPEKSLLGLKRFRETMDRISEIVLPRPRVVGRIGVLYLDRQSWHLIGRETKASAMYFAALRGLQLPSDFVIAEYLEKAEDLSRFEAVVCPVIEYCPEKLRQILRVYVERGGALICAPLALTHDEYGKITSPEKVLGLDFVKQDPVFVDQAAVMGRVIPGRYDATVAVKPSTATPFAPWKDHPGALVWKTVLGNGAIYTLTCSLGDQELFGVLDAIAQDRAIRPRLWVETRESQDRLVSLDLVDRGENKLVHLINWSYVAKWGTLKWSSLEGGLWTISDATSRRGIRSAVGGETFDAADLQKGVPIPLPAQESVLLLISRKPPAWRESWATIESLSNQLAAVIKKDEERLSTILGAKDRAAAGLREARTFPGIYSEKAIPMDLSRHANMGFEDETPNDGLGGATDQGPANDLSTFFSANSGRVNLYGVPYEILDPAKNRGKSICVLRGGDRQSFPMAITGIPVGCIVDQLFFLHASAWTEGKVLWTYRVHYEGGEAMDIPVEKDRTCVDWWGPRDANLASPDARIAWKGKNRGGNEIGLFTMRWKNPRPNSRVVSLDIVSEGKAVPMVVAITALPPGAIAPEPVSISFMKTKLDPSFSPVVFGGDTPILEQDTDGLVLFSAKPRAGQWGGFRFVAAEGKGISLPEGNWVLRFEANYTGVDAFGKVVGVPKMQVRVITTGEEKSKDQPLTPLLDADAKTWETRSIPVGKGPCRVKEVVFQYLFDNPPEGVRLKNLKFESLP